MSIVDTLNNKQYLLMIHIVAKKQAHMKGLIIFCLNQFGDEIYVTEFRVSFIRNMNLTKTIVYAVKMTLSSNQNSKFR